MLPGTNGIQLARLVRERHPGTRVVLTSAYHLSERQLARADCGAAGFVPKPLDLGELAQFLRSKVADARSTRLGAPGDGLAGSTGASRLRARRRRGNRRRRLRVDALHYELPPELIAQRPRRGSRAARAAAPAARAAAPPEHRRVAAARRPDSARCARRRSTTRASSRRASSAASETPGGRVEVFFLRRVEDRARSRPAPGHDATRRDLAGARQVEQAAPVRRRRRHRAPRRAARAARRPRSSSAPRALDGRRSASRSRSGRPRRARRRRRPRAAATFRCRRTSSATTSLEDAERYQTVYARHDGAVAAPTAGLHLTQRAPRRLAARGCEVATHHAARRASGRSSPCRWRTSTTTRCTPSATS